MLTIQPTITNQKTAFCRKLTPEEIEERKVKKQQSELREQQYGFEELAEDEDSPSKWKTFYKAGAIFAGASAVAVGSGWGLRQTIKFFKEINNSKFVKSIKGHLKDCKNFISDSAKTIKSKFLASEAYKKPANAIKRQYNKFADTKIGKPIDKFFKAIKKGIVAVKNKISEGFQYISKKIKGIDKKNAEDTAVNIVGGSTGVAAGINSVRKEQEKGAEE